MSKEIIIIALVLALIYLYYQNQKLRKNPIERVFVGTDNSTSQTLLNLLNVNNLEELKTKLGGKTLDEILEENEDYETEVDTLTRTKNSLEQDLLAQSNAFQNRLREKDRELERLKKDLKEEKGRADKTQEKLTSEKQQHKGSLERISKLTERIMELEKIPGGFPEGDKEVELIKTHQEQLRQINLLFDEKAKDYKEIDFNGLYGLLKGISERERERERERSPSAFSKDGERGSKTDIQSPKEEK